MSFRFCVLASGSKGNSTYIEGPGGALLIDAGLSAKQLVMRMEAKGLDPYEIQGVVVTHEHQDHCRGVRVLCKRLGVPAMTSPKTWEAMQDRQGVFLEELPSECSLEICGLHLRTFSTSHDAMDPMGLVVSCGGASLGICTDLGAPTPVVRHRLSGCNGLVLEANHDPNMLLQGPYPAWLKQRVKGNKGHMSNRQSADLLAELIHHGMQQVVLAHLSETNNFAELARREAQGVMDAAGCKAKLHVASQDEPTEVLEVVPAEPAPPPEAH